MRIDGFYVIGRETPGGPVFLQTYMAGNMLAGHWGEVQYADRFLMLSDAEATRDKVRERAEWVDHPPDVWSVEVTARKVCRREMEETGTQQEAK